MPSPPPGAGTGARSTTAWAVALLAAALAVPVGLQVLGRSGRSGAAGGPVAPPFAAVVLAPAPRDAVAAWRDLGLRGRVLVHFGRFLHFVPDEGMALLSRELRGPGSGAAADDALAARAGRLDYLWSACALGVARRVHYVSPPAALERRAATLPAGASLPARIDWEAFPRTIDAAPPRLAEPAIVDVGASWFDERSGDDLLALLAASGLRADLVTVQLAEGSDDVSDAARRAAREFAARLAGDGRP